VSGSPDASDPLPTIGLPGREFADLCRQMLETAGELRFRAEGLSMRPALKPGDVLCVVPLRDRPACRGDVILASTPRGKPVAHRVVATREKAGVRLYLTAGDALTHEPDPIIPADNVLGVVVAYERDGERRPVPPLGHGVVQHWRGQWRLALYGTVPDASPLRRLGHGAMELWRRASRCTLGLLHALRGCPLVGGPLQRLWPDMGQRCHVQLSVREAPSGPPLYCLDALLRERSVAQQLVCQGYGVAWAGLGSEDQWWLSNIHTHPLYQGRGVTARLLAEALRIAKQAGAEQVLAVIRPGDTEPPRWFQQQGFSVPSEDALTEQLGPHWREATSAAGPATILCVSLVQPPTTPAPT